MKWHFVLFSDFNRFSLIVSLPTKILNDFSLSFFGTPFPEPIQTNERLLFPNAARGSPFGIVQETRIVCRFGSNSVAFDGDCRSTFAGDCLYLSAFDPSNVDCPRIESGLQRPSLVTMRGISCRYSTTFFGSTNSPLSLSIFEHTKQVSTF